MKKLSCLLLVLVCNSVFAVGVGEYKPLIVFSDFHREENKAYDIDVLDFTVSESLATYSVVSLRDTKSRESDYRLFITEEGVVSSFNFPEVSKFKSVSLGKVGFASDGSFVVPFGVGNVNSSFLLYRYSPQDRRMNYLGNLLVGQNSVDAFFVNDVLYFSDKQGKVNFFTKDFSETKNIKDIFINEIYDVKVEGNNLYILASKKIDGNYETVLFIYDRGQLAKKSMMVLKSVPLSSSSKYEMNFLSRKELVITYNPHRAPSLNSSAFLTLVNLETNRVDHEFVLESGKAVSLSLACNKNKITSAVAYTVKNGWYRDLVTSFNGQEIILNMHKNELVKQLRTKFIGYNYFILSVNEKLAGRKSYREIALYHLEPDGLRSCEFDS